MAGFVKAMLKKESWLKLLLLFILNSLICFSRLILSAFLLPPHKVPKTASG
jgi:hypothetical protein